MKRLNIFMIFLMSCILVVTIAQSQDLNSKVNRVMDEYVRLNLFSGTILIAQNGKVVYSEAFGEADKDHHIKNKLKTKFNIGSIGKTFTGVAILQLAEQGKLDVMDPVITYLKDFPFGDSITIHHLLSHTSGTSNYFMHPDFRSKMFQIRSVNDALPLIYDQELLFDTPGERFSYSNSGIVILGAVIEAVTGQSYPDYLQEKILEPCGMKDTGIHYLEEIIKNRAVGYIKMPTGKFMRNVFMVPPPNADGGIETTVMDLLKFDEALYGEKLLSREYKRKMFTPNKNNYGYCWRITKIDGRTCINHGGGAPGVSAQFRRYVDDNYTLIVLSNYSESAGHVANTIEAILYDYKYQKPKQPLSEFLYQNMQKKGMDYVVENFNKIINKNEYHITSSNELNNLGYALLDENVDWAIEILRINTTLFPNEANPYDSLGDAFMKKGDTESAVESFKKALEIDLNFDSSKQKLEMLGENQ